MLATPRIASKLAPTGAPTGSRLQESRASSLRAISATEPAVIFGRDQVITEPTPDKVARLLGLNRDLIDDDAFDVRAGSVKRVAPTIPSYALTKIPKDLPQTGDFWYTFRAFLSGSSCNLAG